MKTLRERIEARIKECKEGLDMLVKKGLVGHILTPQMVEITTLEKVLKMMDEEEGR